jgi:hypothetical protein
MKTVTKNGWEVSSLLVAIHSTHLRILYAISNQYKNLDGKGWLVAVTSGNASCLFGCTAFELRLFKVFRLCFLRFGFAIS